MGQGLAHLGGAGGLEVLLDEASQLRGAEGVDALDADVAVDARRQLVPGEGQGEEWG